MRPVIASNGSLDPRPSRCNRYEYTMALYSAIFLDLFPSSVTLSIASGIDIDRSCPATVGRRRLTRAAILCIRSVHRRIDGYGCLLVETGVALSMACGHSWYVVRGPTS
ncbi:hypothetical protein ABZP36_033451 [Zizania latifolia]